MKQKSRERVWEAVGADGTMGPNNTVAINGKFIKNENTHVAKEKMAEARPKGCISSL